MTLEELQEKTASFHTQLNSDQLMQFQKYAELLMEWNQRINLTAISDYGEIVEKHFYDCILPLQMIDLKGNIADVGTGAGFPGIVWKIMVPSVHLSLIEPTGKRCSFLENVIHVLALDHVEIFNERAEDHAKKRREYYDVTSARAVANLRVLSELTLPLVKNAGWFIAMKGVRGREEADEAENAVSKLGGSLKYIQDTQLTSGDRRINLFIQKEKNTPQMYPRNYGQIKKKPL